ncbi:MAG TPA: tetratricopeptide repeat protein, partial [Pseudodesulfovibrio sp.]|nr:tetratricopeptide repeat protein [Pseudodesulfovibrio sp.]
LDRASALCDEHIARRPKNLLEFFRLKADLSLKMGVYDQAEAVYEKVLAMRAIPWALMGMAKVHFHQRQFQKAQELLRDLLEANDAHVEAYDWLAKCYEKMGEHQEAQEALARAAELSPKSVLRQKALGEVAHKNGDLDAAEKSFSKVIRLGKHSIYKSPSDYTNLSKVFVDKESPSQALKVLGNLQKEYKSDANAEILCRAMEGIAYKKMNRDEDAKQAMESARTLYDKAGGKVPLEVTMDVAKAYLTLDDKEKGSAMIKEIVRNHHDDEDILQQIEGIFEDADLQEEGKRIISATRDEIIGINNKGVSLVKEKKLKEAIDFFDKAADGLPDNKIINMNAA